jgi:hypothetical protein
MNLYDWSVVFLVAFSLLAALDGLYLHLFCYRLHERPESRREHLLHTAGAVLFTPALLLIFILPSSGLILWTGVVLVALGTVIEVLDAGVEKESRAGIGGMTPFESALHVVLTTLRTTAVVLSVLARPELPSGLAQQVAIQLAPGAIAVAALHVALAVRPDLLRRALSFCTCGEYRPEASVDRSSIR